MKNKISRVVIASTDPNPLVNEQSINKLRNNKITVTTNICEEEAKELNKSFFYKYKFNKPYIRLKLAVSIDGKIANQQKESKWITSSQSRMFVQKLRAEVNAILTTSSTVLHDNPKMNIRDEKLLKNLASQPAVILLDRNLSVPPTSNIFKANRLVIIITNIDNSTNAPLRIYNDNVVIKYVKTTDSKIVLEDIYNIAKMYNLDDILVECGSSFSGTLLTEDAVDELLYFVAPKILGDQSISFSGIVPINKLKNKKTYKIKNIKSYKNDLYLDMRRN
jgi:diaminohydroxyphosphoribosylaminopyrimidine deaminase/5-amino-6-(5-phosphoribosylamino)uracil reductase